MTAGQTTQLTATATLSNNTMQNVTSSSTWSSSNGAVASVSGGLVTAHSVGSASVTATNQGVTGSTVITVQVPSQQAFTLLGVVTEVGATRAVVGARVEIRDGPSAGRATITDGNGFYSIAPVLSSSFTLRGTHANYQTTDVPVTVSGDRRLDFQMRRVVQPVLRANPGGPYSADAGSNVTMTGLASTSAPFSIAHYRWNCGQADNPNNCEQDTPTPTFKYVRIGSTDSPPRIYTVTLTIQDTQGNKDTATTTVTVRQTY
jgi:hypothetical protein